MIIFKPNDLPSPPRADMFLPDFLKKFSFFLDFLAVAFGVATIVTHILILIIAVILLGGFGAATWLCWKNQTIKIINDDQFEYTTFMGRTTVYRFSDIKGLRANNDSWTLFLTNGKVHIEAIACMSETLCNKINAAIAKK